MKAIALLTIALAISCSGDKAEVVLGGNILNRCLDLGRPVSVCVG